MQDSHLTVGNAIEIVGKVNQDLSIKVLQATDMGLNLGTFILIYTRFYLYETFLAASN